MRRTSFELILTAAGNSLYAAVFLLVGLGMRRRFHDPARPFAARAFVLWWYVMAAQAATVAFAQAAVVAGVGSVLLFRVLFSLVLLFASAQIWALGHYILYLWGAETRHVQLPLAAFAAGYFLYFFLLLGLIGGQGVAEGPWGGGLGLGPVADHLPVLATLLFLPYFALIAAYYLLAFRTDSPTQRTRVLVLGTAACVWNLAHVAQFAGQAGRGNVLHGLFIALNLVWALVLWLTYFPPATLRRVFGIRGLDVARGVETTP